MTMNRGRQGRPREKLITFLSRGGTIFCPHVNRFLTVSLLSEMFTQQNSNFQGENCLKKCNFWPKLPPPPWCPVQVFVKSKIKPQSVVSSEVLTTHKVWRKVFFYHFNFAQSLATFVLKIVMPAVKRDKKKNSNSPEMQLLKAIKWNLHRNALVFSITLLWKPAWEVLQKQPSMKPQLRHSDQVSCPASTGKEKWMKLTGPVTFIHINKYSKTEILAFCY